MESIKDNTISISTQGVDVFRTECKNTFDNSYTLFEATKEGISIEVNNVSDGATSKFVQATTSITTEVTSATEGSSSVIQTADSIISRVEALNGRSSEIVQTANDLTVRLQNQYNKAESDFAALTINESGVYFVNSAITLEGATTVNSSVTIDEQGYLTANEVNFNGQLNTSSKSSQTEFLYSPQIANEEIGASTAWKLWTESSGLTTPQDFDDITPNIYYDSYKRSVIVPTNTLSYTFTFDSRNKESSQFSIYLPMDPEYIGTTIKINILNTVEYGTTNTSNGATPIISLICGRSCNYNLYVSGETSGVATAKTMADFYKDYPYNRQNLYPYAFEYLCANDAKYLGGIERKNGTDITKQVNKLLSIVHL